jgi:hypothetical protein
VKTDTTIEVSFAAIEHPRTAAEVNVASGFRSFLRGLVRLQPLKELVVRAREDQNVGWAILLRLLHLAELRIDRRYENPNDVAMAAYLVILRSVASELYDFGAAAVLAAENCWWASKIASVPREQTTQASGLATTFASSETGKPNCVAYANDSAEVFVTAGNLGTMPILQHVQSAESSGTDTQGSRLESRAEVAMDVCLIAA